MESEPFTAEQIVGLLLKLADRNDMDTEASLQLCLAATIVTMAHHAAEDQQHTPRLVEQMKALKGTRQEQMP